MTMPSSTCGSQCKEKWDRQFYICRAGLDRLHYISAKLADIEVASPRGGLAPFDESSVEKYKEDKLCIEFLNVSSGADF